MSKGSLIEQTTHPGLGLRALARTEKWHDGYAEDSVHRGEGEEGAGQPADLPM